LPSLAAAPTVNANTCDVACRVHDHHEGKPRGRWRLHRLSVSRPGAGKIH
jgi:hypothetical protein